ncbi:MAG TPA: hydroxymethylbilane synthase [bacterium]|nr:hydroxymethylbilane synthase [bacterium]
MTRTLRVGTRGSRLSLRQTQIFVDALRAHRPDVAVETVVVHSAGDRAADVPLEQLEGIGFFAKELETAVAGGGCDVAVHSAKDLPTTLHAALRLGAVLPRGDPRDVLVSRGDLPLADLPFGARVATSSVRRAAQLRARRPDLVIVSIRGNLDTRLAKLDRGDADALCIAAAGLVRMGWENRVAEWLEPEVMLPAPAQGALAVEARRDDGAVLDLLRLVDDPATHEAVTAERAFVGRLGSGCRAPAGALAAVERGRVTLEGLLASEDGRIVRRHRATGPVGAARWLGCAVADRVYADAGEITGETPVPAAREPLRRAR